MNAIRECRVGELIVRIDRSLCVGFGDCVAEAPTAFELDDDNLVVFTQPDAAEIQSLLAACEACPVDALSVVDTSRQTICPTSFSSSADTRGEN